MVLRNSGNSDIVQSLKLAGKGPPWWTSSWESACQRRGHRVIPGPGRLHMPRETPRAAEQLSVHHNY